MKSTFTLMALATSVIATGGYYPHGGNNYGGDNYGTTLPPTTVQTTYEVDVTYTSYCPVTEVVTYPGSTVETTYTSTNVYVTKVPTTIYETVYGPAVTETEGDLVYTTLTSLCPVTETKTVGGETVVVTWTSTSTIHAAVPTTAVNYVSYTVTEHATTEVYETVLCPETTYTTISEGSTIYITETGTETVYTTKEYIITETVPVTQTTEVEVTVTSALSAGGTVTEYPTVIVTHSDTTFVPISPPPVTATYPTTVFTSVGTTFPVSTSTSIFVPPNAAAQATPAVLLLLGAAGLAAFL